MNFRNMAGSESATPLARQLSVYSLTFDEFQNTLGATQRDFGSMNMDEFLRNILTAEETQAMTSAIGAGATSAGEISGAGGTHGAAATSSLQKQGSLTLPRTLSQKTVDEVWRELLRESTTTDGPDLPQPQHQRQPTLGEMTLEEFLVRAGVVRDEPVQKPIISSNNGNGNGNGAVNSSSNSIFFGELPNSSNGNHHRHPGLSLGFAPAPALQNLSRNQIGNVNLAAKRAYPGTVQVGDQRMGNGLISGGVVGLGGGGGATVAEVGSPEGMGKGNGDLSSLSPVPYVFGSGMRGRKCSGAVEKVVERRQRRMIKNRESAARSRARKQAYTMELEAEVAKLKEQNLELQKKQAEIMEMQKNQVMELINQQRGPKKLCLRRTQTGPW